MKVRQYELRRLPDDQRIHLHDLIKAVPRGATRDHSTVSDLADFYRTLKKPYWAPAPAADYQIRLGVPVPDVLDQLRDLVACDDWGRTPGSSQPNTRFAYRTTR